MNPANIMNLFYKLLVRAVRKSRFVEFRLHRRVLVSELADSKRLSLVICQSEIVLRTQKCILGLLQGGD